MQTPRATGRTSEPVGQRVGQTPARLRLRLLGTFRAAWDEAPIARLEASPRARALLQHLVLAPGSPIARAELAAELWPDVPDAQARTNLRQALARLVHVLPAAADFVRATPTSVGWRGGLLAAVDVHAFTAAVAAADAAHRAGDTARQMAALTAAADVYAGDLVVDVSSERLERARSNLLQAAQRTLATLAELQQATGDDRGAIRSLERLLELDPLDEPTHRRLMSLHAAAGDRAKALRVFERLRATLREEVGDVPSRSTLDVAERLRADAHARRAEHLAGRETEIAALDALLARAKVEGPRLIVIRGEPGIGKTALLGELSARLEAIGDAALSAQATPADAVTPYGVAARLLGPARLLGAARRLAPPWSSELRRLAGVDVALPRATAGDRLGPTGAAELRAALHDALTGADANAVLILDDAQHLDRESAAWLSELFADPREPRRPTAIVVAAPDDDVDAPHLAALLQRVAAIGRAVDVRLGPLGRNGVAALAATLRGAEVSAAEVDALMGRTQGHPLFVIELVSADASDEGRREGAPPPRLEALLEARLRRLPTRAAEALDALAVLGPDGGVDTVARLTRRSREQVGDDLDLLWRRRFVEIDGGGASVTAHPLAREVAYTRLPPARRALLHERAAEALRRGAAGRAPRDAAVAHHLERAGRRRDAATALARAAERAAAVAADDDAIAFYRRAIDLHGDGNAPSSAELAALWQGLGDVHARRLQGDAARDAYRAAVRHAAGDPIAAAALAHRIAATHTDERTYDEALADLDAADALLRSSRRRGGRWWRTAIDVDELRTRVMYFLPSVDDAEAAALLERLDEAVERHGTLAQRLERDYAALRFDMRRERYHLSPATVGRTAHTARTAAATGHATAMAEAGFVTGFAALFGGDPARAIGALQEARQLAARCGARLFQVQSVAYLSLSLRLTGRLADAASLQPDLDACVDDTTPLYRGLALAQRGWLAYRDGRVDDARSACKAALADWSSRWYPLRWTSFLTLLAMADEPRVARSAAEAMLRDDQQQLPEGLASALRALARSRGDWATRRDAAVRIAHELHHL
jgi:DNA-binding SARP family transcriptional activator